jgi:histidine transport system substrate-binding protein
MGMTRRCLVMLAAVLLAAPLARGADLPELQKTGTLRVLVVDGSPAFFALHPSAPDRPGLDREILDGFCRLNKLTLKVVEVPSWDALVPQLLAGQGDVAAGGVTATESRKKLVGFTAEVFPTRDVVLTRKPHRVVQTLDQFREEKVGVIKGTSMAENAAAAGLKSVDDSLGSDGIQSALAAGKVTASVDGVEDALLLQQGDPALQIGMFLGPPASLAFAVRKGDTALRGALDDYIGNLRRTPTWSRLVVKYFGVSALEVLKKARAQ